MPGDQTDLGRTRSSILGQEGVRDTIDSTARTSQYGKLLFLRNIKGTGKKIRLRVEDNLDNFIDVDYNPTEYAFSKVINWNDKTVIGGQEALEFKGIGRREFTWGFLFTDFGYHSSKTPEETVLAKLNWLEDRTSPNRKFVDGEPVDIPDILFLEKGNDVIRVVILKIDGKEIFLKENFDPDRAVVNITFRRVERPFGQGRIGTLRRRMF